MPDFPDRDTIRERMTRSVFPPKVPIVVTHVGVDLQAATITLSLSCGHTYPPFVIAACPIVSVERTLGIPDVGEAVICPTCGSERDAGLP